MTETVLAKREAQRERERTEALLQRQYELIDCLGWVSDVGRSAKDDSKALKLIESVSRQIIFSGKSAEGDVSQRIELLEFIGQGSVSLDSIIP